MAVVIAGGGLTGLLAARFLLTKKNFDQDIFIIEQSTKLGGLLGSIEDEKGGIFDYGIHILQDSANPHLNQSIRSILPEDQWIKINSKKKDIRGLYANGSLQKNSPFIDLRTLPKNEYKKCLDNFLLNLNDKLKENSTKIETAFDYLCHRYGKYITQNYLSKPLEKLFKTTADKLHPYSCKLIPLDRITLFNENEFKDLQIPNKIFVYEQLFASNEDTPFPHYLTEVKERFYPQKYGMKYLVDAISAQYPKNRVKIITNACLTAIHYKQNQINSLEISANNEKTIIDNVKGLIWTAGTSALAKLLVKDPLQLNYDRGPTTSIVNILLDKPDNLEKLLYAYCYEKDFLSFRFCSPYRLCPQSVRNHLFPFSIEVIHDKQWTSAQIIEKTINECKFFGVISEKSEVCWVNSYELPNGYPLISKNNINNLKITRDKISEFEIQNLKIAGTLAKDNLFYQTDIFSHCYDEVMSLN